MRMTFKDFLFRLLMAAALAASCCGLSQVAQAQGLGGAHQTRVAGKGGYDSRIFADRPTSYWPLREVTGTTAADRLGVNNGTFTGALANGTYTGGYTLNQTGPLTGGGGVLLNGSTGYVNCGTLGSFGSSRGAGVTMEAWVRTTSTAIGGLMGVRDSSTGQNGMTLRINSQSDGTNTAGCIRVALVSNDVSVKQLAAGVDSATNLNDGSWHHVAATAVGSTNTILIYVDGVSRTVTYNLQQTPTSFANFAQNFIVGATGNETGTPATMLNGRISAAAIYPTALTAGQIAAHAAATDFSAYAALVRRDGATSFFPLNETTGTTAVDVLTTAGAYTLGQQGPLARMPSGGGGVLLNGSTGYVDCGTPSSLAFSGSFTIEAWVKLGASSTTLYQTIAGRWRDAAGVRAYFLGFGPTTGSDNGVIFYTTSGSTNKNITSAATESTFVGRWTHIAGVYDSANTKMTLYINGVAETPVTSVAQPNTGSTLNFEIGNHTSNTAFFNGSIAAVAAYAAALTANQIYSHWAAGARGYSMLRLDNPFDDARFGNLCSMTLKLHQPITLRRAA